MIDQLLDHLANTNEEHLHDGINWYRKANAICVKLSLKHDLPLYKVVGILAALSPRNKWERNIIDTESIIIHGINASVCTFNANKEKAVKILNCGDEHKVFRLLNGRKVQSFYTNILRCNEPNKVTVDIWAMRSVGLNRAPNKGLYDAVEEAYRLLGDLMGIKPHEAQAVIWGVVRG